MGTSLRDGYVAVRRWFPSGEGWAAHPELVNRHQQLLDALAGPLVAAPGDFCVTGLGGLLIGEKIPDDHCPNPAARDRHPMLVRAVLIHPAATDDERREFLRQLRSLPVPNAAGADASLALGSSPVRPAPAADEGWASLPPARRLLLIVGLGFIAILVTVLGLRLLIQELMKSGDQGLPSPFVLPTSRDRPVVKPAADPRVLTPVDGKVPFLEARTKASFEQAIGGAAIYEHPYVMYLKETAARLPETTPRCRSDDEVVAALRTLLQRLKPELTAADWPAGKLREAIDRELDYDAWRQKVGRRPFADRDKPLPDSLRRFVDQFRSPEAGITAAADRMAEALKQWGVTDLPSDPFALISRFFELLTRPAGAPPPAKVDHPGVEFLHRLPPEPVAAGRTFDAEEDLSTALRHLLYLLNRDFHPHTPMPARDLVDRIVGEMRYADFEKRSRSRHYRDANVSADLAKLWKRFE